MRDRGSEVMPCLFRHVTGYVTLVLVAVAAPTLANTLSGRVVSIADGDTVTVLDSANTQHKIRLAGIDAPEKAQPFGDKSKTNLARLVFNQEVQVEWSKQDRYGRVVGKVLMRKPGCSSCAFDLDTSLVQVSEGMAWWYQKYAKEQTKKDREDYEVAEFQAKIKRLGLWSDKNPTPPWEWRRGGR